MATVQDNPGCLTSILKFLGLSKPLRTKTYPYKLRDDFLTNAEMRFYQSLTAIVKSNAVICPKVRLSDVFIPHHTEDFRRFNNYIMQKHIDFLLCDPTSMRPLLGIELDDKSHQRADRQDRDDFIDHLYTAADLPLVHVKVQVGYDLAALTQQLSPYIPTMAPVESKAPQARTEASETRTTSSPEPSIDQPPVALAATPPLCPKHGVPMIIRTASQGDRKGKHFYGCPKYPACHEIINIDP